MPETPSLKDWLKNNPGKGINDYYKEFPVRLNLEAGNQAPVKMYFQEGKRSGAIIHHHSYPDLALILFSFLLIVAFFLPWVDFNLPDFQVGPFSADDLWNYKDIKGDEVPALIGFLANGISRAGLFSIYLIPAMAFLVIMAEMSHQDLLRVSGEVILVILILYWMSILNSMFLVVESAIGKEINPFKFYSFGLLLTLFGAVYYVFDLGRVLIMDR